MEHYIRNEDEDLPPIDRFNLGQKYFFWAMLFAGALLLISGVALWFPEGLAPTVRGALRDERVSMPAWEPPKAPDERGRARFVGAASSRRRHASAHVGGCRPRCRGADAPAQIRSSRRDRCPRSRSASPCAAAGADRAASPSPPCARPGATSSPRLRAKRNWGRLHKFERLDHLLRRGLVFFEMSSVCGVAAIDGECVTDHEACARTAEPQDS